MDALRVEVERIAGARALGGLPLDPARDRLAERPRPGEPGAGPHARLRWRSIGIGGRFSLRPRIGYGTSDERVTGGLTLLAGTGATQLSLGAERQIRDFATSR